MRYQNIQSRFLHLHHIYKQTMLLPCKKGYSLSINVDTDYKSVFVDFISFLITRCRLYLLYCYY